MTRNRIILIMVGVICVFLGYNSKGNTENIDRWILYGTSERGDQHYYDEKSMTYVGQNIIKYGMIK